MADSRRQQQRAKPHYVTPKERAESRESGFKPTSILIPEGMKMFKVKKEGVYRLNLLPYIANAKNPDADEGFWCYERTYFVHARVGVEGNSYCCPNKTFRTKEPCPICKVASERWNGTEEDKKVAKTLFAKQRQLFVLEDVDNPALGVQMFDMSFHLFGKMLEAKTKGRDKYSGFYHLEGGLTLEVTFEEKKNPGFPAFYEATNIELESREDYDEEIMDKIPCLDDQLIRIEAADLKDIFLGAPTDDEEKDDDEGAPSSRPATSRNPPVRPNLDEDEDDEPATNATRRLADDDEDEEEPAPRRFKTNRR